MTLWQPSPYLTCNFPVTAAGFDSGRTGADDWFCDALAIRRIVGLLAPPSSWRRASTRLLVPWFSSSSSLMRCCSECFNSSPLLLAATKLFWAWGWHTTDSYIGI